MILLLLKYFISSLFYCFDCRRQWLANKPCAEVKRDGYISKYDEIILAFQLENDSIHMEAQMHWKETMIWQTVMLRSAV